MAFLINTFGKDYAVIGKFKNPNGTIKGWRLGWGEPGNRTYIADLFSTGSNHEEFHLGEIRILRSELERKSAPVISESTPVGKKEYIRVNETHGTIVWVRTANAKKMAKDISNFMTLINESDFYKIWRKVSLRSIKIVDNGFFATFEGKKLDTPMNFEDIDEWLRRNGVSGFSRKDFVSGEQDSKKDKTIFGSKERTTYTYSSGYIFMNGKAIIPEMKATRQYVSSGIASCTIETNPYVYCLMGDKMFEISKTAVLESSAIKIPPFTSKPNNLPNTGKIHVDYLLSDDESGLVNVDVSTPLTFPENHSGVIALKLKEAIKNTETLLEVCDNIDEQLTFSPYEVNGVAFRRYRMAYSVKADFSLLPFAPDEIVKVIGEEFASRVQEVDIPNTDNLIYPVEDVTSSVSCPDSENIVFALEILTPKKEKNPSWIF